jgi:ATP-dependent Clp protease ATP-binding subunit ClpB
LLQVLDEGRLTDGQGRTVDFSNTVIIMTSNLGSAVIQSMAGGEYNDMKNAVMEIVGTHFRPEVINRIDDSVVFRPLGKEEIRKIAGIQLQQLGARLADSDLEIEFSNEALDLIGAEGFDPVYGARPLKRTIQNEIENPLGQKILSGEFAWGEKIKVELEEGKIVFKH